MRCDQCDSDDLIKQYRKDMAHALVCNDCGNSMPTGRDCDRCDSTAASIFDAVFTFPRYGAAYARRRRERCKIRRCSECAKRLGIRWRKRDVAQG